MLRVALVAASLALASPAFADCYLGPDDVDTGFVANNVARSVCLQRDLAEQSRQRAELARLQMQLDALNRQIQVDRLRQPLFR